MSEGLRECPFCGSKASLGTVITGIERVAFFAHCTRCEAEMNKDAPNSERKHAIAAWNTRTQSPSPELVEALSGLTDDYMTSENHHPGYVLIPTAKFTQLTAIIGTSTPDRGSSND